MKSKSFCRRSFLKTLGLSAILLPLLDLELEGPARGAPSLPVTPKRFVALVWPNGVTNNYWPTGGESSFVLTDVLSPLAPHRNDILILDGIDNRPMMDQFPDYGGHASLPYLLTGGMAKGPIGDLAAIGDSISLDQYLAKKQTTPVGSLVIGVDNREENDISTKYVSYSGSAVGNQPNAPAVMDDVHAIYSKLFSSSGVDAATLARLRAERKSVLDFVGTDLARFQKRLGTEGRQKVELHLQSIRNIEARLDGIATGSLPPPPAAGLDSYSKDQYDAIAKAQIDMVVGALATGQTNLATMLWSNGHNNSWVFKWLGGDFNQAGDGSFNPLRSHHEMAHRGGDGAGGGDDARRKDTVDKYFIGQFAYFIAQCKAVKEGSGTLLDNTVLLLANNMGNGASHANTRLPWILAGKCGGYFRTGRYVKVPGTPLNRVLVSIANAMGDPLTSFGPAQYGGALPQLQ